MEIRRARPEDASEITALEELIFSDPWSERSVRDCIGGTGMCFVARDESGVIAYMIGSLIAPEGEIYRIAVKEEKRKRGIGYRLLDFAVKTERGRGLETLFLEVRSQNTAARNLYRAYGFEEISVRKNYYRDPTDDAVIMLKANPADIKMPYG
jgi:ribosomal-protein-alanine N-acetyltransferase